MSLVRIYQDKVVNFLRVHPFIKFWLAECQGQILGEGAGGAHPPPPEMTCGFLIQLVSCKKKKTMWFIGVEVEQKTSAPPPKKSWIRPCKTFLFLHSTFLIRASNVVKTCCLLNFASSSSLILEHIPSLGTTISQKRACSPLTVNRCGHNG